MKFFSAALGLTVAASTLLQGVSCGRDIGNLLRSLLEEQNKDVVVKVHTDVVINGANDPAKAGETMLEYIHPEVRQHNPDGPDGQGFYEALFIGENRPQIDYEINAAIVDGDFVALYYRVLAPDFHEGPQIGVDLLLVDDDGLITDHWDIHWDEVPANETVSGNSMYPIDNPPTRSGPNEGRNRLRVTYAINRVFTHADSSVVDEYFAEDVKLHDPASPNGRDFIRDFADSLTAGDVTYEIGGVLAYGDIVVVHNRVGGDIGFDLYRVDDDSGLITDIWNVRQPEVAPTATLSGNAMFPMY